MDEKIFDKIKFYEKSGERYDYVSQCHKQERFTNSHIPIYRDRVE